LGQAGPSRGTAPAPAVHPASPQARWRCAGRAGESGRCLENLSITVDPTTNHISTTPYAYNADGALTNDGVHASTYTYDAENRITNWNTTNFTYDGDSLRVYKSGYRLYWRGGGTQVIGETDL